MLCYCSNVHGQANDCRLNCFWDHGILKSHAEMSWHGSGLLWKTHGKVLLHNRTSSKSGNRQMQEQISASEQLHLRRNNSIRTQEKRTQNLDKLLETSRRRGSRRKALKILWSEAGEDSAVKSTSWRWVLFQFPQGGSELSSLQFPGFHHCLLVLVRTSHIHGAQIHYRQNTLQHKIKINKSLKNILYSFSIGERERTLKKNSCSVHMCLHSLH